jgi:very-short-patch-repair endonuclease
MAKFWNYEKNGTTTPESVFLSSNKKYFFDCEICNLTFDASLVNIKSGHWCPTCKFKTEKKLLEILQPIYSSIERQLRVQWCKNILCLPFDFAIQVKKVIIELDGRQHFKQVANWQSPQDQFERDLFKQSCANENGYSTIRILQEDVWKDKYDWLSALRAATHRHKFPGKIMLSGTRRRIQMFQNLLRTDYN